MTEKIQGGYILLARKMLESEIMEKPPLYFKLFGWMLLQAKFRPKDGLERGQFQTSIKEMQSAMAHFVGYRKETPTVKQIRKAYEGLAKGSMIGTTKGTDGLIITILNYDKYQEPKNYEGHHEGHHEGEVEGTPYNKEKKEKNGNISRGKFALDLFAPEINGWDKAAVEKTIDGFISMRKTNQISAGVIESEFEYWRKYSDYVVNISLKLYAEKRYWEKGKGEKYLRGIIRGKDSEIQKLNSKSLFQKGF